jgi:cytochrome c553
MAMIRSLVVMLALIGCSRNTDPPPPTSGSPTARPESGPSHTRHSNPGGNGLSAVEIAQRRYATLCSNCHGMDGTANTPTGNALNPKPRDYTDPKWQASVTDQQIADIILKGGQAVGKSNLMPGNPDLASRPDVIDELVKIVRGFGKKP